MERSHPKNRLVPNVTLFAVCLVMMVVLRTTTEWHTVVRLGLSVAVALVASFAVSALVARRSGS
jgi:hypothetical protein